MHDWFTSQYAKISGGFSVAGVNGIEWTFAPLLQRAGGVQHGFTRRMGGMSGPPFSALNLGWNRDEPRETIGGNYRLLSAAAGFPYESMALVRYEHGDGVVRAHAADCGKGMSDREEDVFEPCDALIADEKGITLVTLHADCMCVFLYDPVSRAVGIAHAGWKGVSLRIGAKTARRMEAELGCQSGRMLAALSPAISQARFEVETPVMEVFHREFAEADCIRDGVKPGKYHIDLYRAMALQLLEAGLDARNIALSGECTYDNPALYYSYRRDAKAAGAMAGFIRLI